MCLELLVCLWHAALERIRQRAQQGGATDDNEEDNDEEESSSDHEVYMSCIIVRL